MSEILYISYPRRQTRDYARRLSESLNRDGLPNWYDERQIDPSHDLSAEVERGIDNAACVLVCVTEGDDCPFMLREITYARYAGKPILPLIFPKATPQGLLAELDAVSFCQADRPGRLNFRNGMALLRDRLQDEAPWPPPPDFNPLRLRLFEVYQQIVTYLDTTVYALIRRASHHHNRTRPLNLRYAGGHIHHKASEFATLTDAFDACQHRLVLLGSPASGKTGRLLAFAREAVIQRLNDPEALLPIIASIGAWDNELSITEWLAAETGIDEDTIRQHISSKQALLLLDGLEELPGPVYDSTRPEGVSPDLRAEFVHALSQLVPTPTLLTCRKTDYERVQPASAEAIAFDHTVTICELDQAQIDAYLDAQGDLRELIKEDRRFAETVRNPLLLTLLAFVYEDLGDKVSLLPEASQHTPALWKMLFEALVEKLCTDHDEMMSPHAERIHETLQDLAAHMYMQTWQMYADKPSLLLSDYQLEQTMPDLDALEHAQRLGLLVRHVSGGVQFISNILRDCFAYERLVWFLKSPKVEQRLGAARALGLLRDERAQEVLRTAFHVEHDAYVQYAIRAALDKLQPVFSTFVSYRRRDWGITFLVEEHLKRQLDARVFIDRFIDDVDFEASILRNLREASVFVLIVTEHTFDPARIHLERDWVRKEIQEALARDIPCLMIFADEGYRLPAEEYLPASLRPILSRQGYPLNPGSFEQDIRRIAEFITTISPIKRRESTPGTGVFASRQPPTPSEG